MGNVHMKKTSLRKNSLSPTAVLKREIQRLLREVVIARDKGCILRFLRHCGGEVGKRTIQADHLITRANSATYGDSRLVVCVCSGCHLWKKYNKEEYDALVKTILPKDIVELWEKCQKDSWRPKRTTSYDWKLQLLALKQELEHLTMLALSTEGY